MNLIIDTFIGFFSLYFALWLSIIFHEGFHFLAGKLLGIKVLEVHLGSGEKPFQFKFKKIKFKIDDNPLGGAVLFKLKKGQTNKYAIVAASGLVGDIVLLCICPWMIVKMVCVFFICTFIFTTDFKQLVEIAIINYKIRVCKNRVMKKLKKK